MYYVNIFITYTLYYKLMYIIFKLLVYFATGRIDRLKTAPWLKCWACLLCILNVSEKRHDITIYLEAMNINTLDIIIPCCNRQTYMPASVKIVLLF